MSENFAPAAQFYSHLVSNKNFEYEENITKKNGYFKKIMVTSTKLKKKHCVVQSKKDSIAHDVLRCSHRTPSYSAHYYILRTAAYV